MTHVEQSRPEVEAGRETDARVAVEVMGWRHQPGTVDIYYPPDVPLDTPCTMVRWLPHFSTDRAAALEVVDRLIALGFSVDIYFCREGADVRIYGDGAIQSVAMRETMPLALCEAALDHARLEHLKAGRTDV